MLFDTVFVFLDRFPEVLPVVWTSCRFLEICRTCVEPSIVDVVGLAELDRQMDGFVRSMPLIDSLLPRQRLVGDGVGVLSNDLGAFEAKNT